MKPVNQAKIDVAQGVINIYHENAMRSGLSILGKIIQYCNKTISEAKNDG